MVFAFVAPTFAFLLSPLLGDGKNAFEREEFLFPKENHWERGVGERTSLGENTRFCKLKYNVFFQYLKKLLFNTGVDVLKKISDFFFLERKVEKKSLVLKVEFTH